MHLNESAVAIKLPALQSVFHSVSHFASTLWAGHYCCGADDTDFLVLIALWI